MCVLCAGWISGLVQRPCRALMDCETYDPTHKHQVTEAGSTAYEYSYDANGNMLSRAGSSVSWTSYNYPSGINDPATGETVGVSYGPDRKPWLETTSSASGTTDTYRLGNLMDIVEGGSGAVDRDYIYAGSEPVAVDDVGNGATGVQYFQTDNQGSIAEVTNSSGQIVVDESFTAYGARRNPATWSGPPSSADLTTIAGITQHGYTFQRVLAKQMGLNDMVGRVEDAVTGRFLSADPGVPYPSDPQSYDDYSYTRNNPLTYTDPSGFDDKTNCSGEGTGCEGGGDSTLHTITVTASREGGQSGQSGGSGAVTGLSFDGGSDGGGASRPGPIRPGAPGKPSPQSNPPDVAPLKQVVITPDSGQVQECVACELAGVFAPVMTDVLDGIGALRAILTGGKTPANDVPIDPNKQNHIFGNPVHNLDSVVQQYGSQEAAYSAINQAVSDQLGMGGVGTFSTTVNVGGTDVTVTGAYVDGIPRIGTAYVR